MHSIANGVRPGDGIGRRIENSQIAGKESTGSLILLTGDIEGVAVKNGVGRSVRDGDVALRHQSDAAGAGAARIDGGSRDGNGREAGGRAATLGTTVDDISRGAIRRKDGLDGMIEGGRGSGTDGKHTPRGLPLRLAVLGAQVVRIVRCRSLLRLVQLHNAVNSEARRIIDIHRMAAGLRGVLDEHQRNRFHRDSPRFRKHSVDSARGRYCCCD